MRNIVRDIRHIARHFVCHRVLYSFSVSVFICKFCSCIYVHVFTSFHGNKFAVFKRVKRVRFYCLAVNFVRLKSNKFVFTSGFIVRPLGDSYITSQRSFSLAFYPGGNCKSVFSRIRGGAENASCPLSLNAVQTLCDSSQAIKTFIFIFPFARVAVSSARLI